MRTFMCLWIIGLATMGTGGLPLYGQIGPIQSCEWLPYVKETTTLVVLDSADTPYNRIIRPWVNAYWELSPVKFIPRDSLYRYIGERDYSMLFKNNVARLERRVRGTSRIQFNEIGLYLCNKNQLDHYRSGDAIGKILVEEIDKPETYEYKLGALLRAMYQYLVLLDAGKIDKNNYEEELEVYLNRFNLDIPDYVLWVDKAELPDRITDERSMQRYYKHPFRLVDKEEIQEATARADSRVAILHLHPRASRVDVIAVHDGKMLYSQTTRKYGQLSVQDLVSISRAGR